MRICSRICRHNSELRTFINDTIYKSLSSDLQNVITTTKVISGHGSTSGETNFETQDKLYLLSGEEIYGDYPSSIDTAVGTSKQLDYYKNQGVTTTNYAGAIKQYNGNNLEWWLRSVYSNSTYRFLTVRNNGPLSSEIAIDSLGVSPAFRLQGPVPVSFSEDSWQTIQKTVKAGNTDKYNVGDTKEVDLGTLGTHTVRIANKSECTTETSETACGFVVEFVDIIEKHNYNKADTTNPYGTNVGGWRDSELRTYINDTIYKSLPSDLQNVITTTKVISGHGSTSGETNFETQDKLYLLNAQEVWSTNDYDTSVGTSKQLDYYKNQGVTENNYAGAKKQYNGSNYYWWLRSAESNATDIFLFVSDSGYRSSYGANGSYGVSPAFRIA